MLQGSSDSGKGGSDIHGGLSERSAHYTSQNDHTKIVYQFELPRYLCGRLIGFHGQHVSLIRSRCDATVIVNRHPYTPELKICTIEGEKKESNSHPRKEFTNNFTQKFYRNAVSSKRCSADDSFSISSAGLSRSNFATN